MKLVRDKNAFEVYMVTKTETTIMLVSFFEICIL